MGNQGMTNWKLTALFAISLMLIAGLFSNAAIADGEGAISVKWEPGDDSFAAMAADWRGNDGLYYVDDDGADTTPAPLPAGSTENQLQFSYRVGSNMSGGQVKIEFPSDWAIVNTLTDVADTEFDVFTRYGDSALLVEVIERFDDEAGNIGSVIYRTNSANMQAATGGATLTVDDLTDEIKAAAARVSVSATAVTVTLSKEWRGGGELLVILRNVTTAVPSSLGSVDATSGIPYHSARITTFSKKSGILVRLRPVKIDHDADDVDEEIDVSPEIFSTQPFVRVGNILGNRVDDDGVAADVQHYGQDTIERKFTITDGDDDGGIVYQGESNKVFKVEFVANGPMYAIGANKASIAVTIPEELFPTVPQLGAAVEDNQTEYVQNHIRVTTSGRAKRSGPPVVDNEAVGTGQVVTINFDWINKGAKVVLTYTYEGAPDYEGAVVRVDLIPASGGVTAEVTAFDAETTVPQTDEVTAGAGIAATLVTGGEIHPQEGSGTIAFTSPSDAQVEAGTNLRTLSLTYTASTAIGIVNIEVDVKGIVEVSDSVDPEDDKALQTTDSGSADYGYVFGSNPDIDPVITVNDITDTDGNVINRISFTGVEFKKKGDRFTLTIKNVDIQDKGAALTWTTRIGTDALDEDDVLNESPVLYITDTTTNAVVFTMGDDSSFAIFKAAQELDMVEFKFAAVNTSIKDGQLQFTIPSGWGPTPTTADAAGNVAASDIDKKFIRLSGSGNRTVTITVEKLPKDGFTTITYKGKDTAKITVQPNATAVDKPVEVQGYFWTSSPLSKRRSAGIVEIEVTQVEDGYGTATIEAAAANDATVKAGSDNNIIQVEFTAVGTMDGGAVSLERAERWGAFQADDATIRNYVEVKVVKGRGKLDTVDVGPDIVIAYLEAFPVNSVIRFTYGNGTVRTQNGAEAQANIGLAEFTIQTDGDGDGDFAEVRGTERTAAEIEKTPKPLGAVYRDAIGVVRVDVTGADDGSGSAEVEIVATEQGVGSYPDTDDFDEDGDRKEVLEDLMRIHAGDTDTYLKFTYTPSQTIEDGQLQFTVHGDWSDPQDTPGTDGYTYFLQTGSNTDIGPASFDENSQTATVDIFHIDTSGSIEIHYGAFDIEGDGSGAHALKAASTSSPFTIEVKGGDATTNRFSAIKTDKNRPIAVRVLAQASGGGSAAIEGLDDLDLTAGGMDAEITVVYTAAGEINNGMLKLTIPAKWSAPMTGAMGNVVVTSAGRTGAIDAGGNYGEDDTLPEGLGAMDVNVAGVNLDADDTVTFTYSNVMVQPTTGDATFAVTVDGGAGPGTTDKPTVAKPVSADPEGSLTVSVGEASTRFWYGYGSSAGCQSQFARKYPNLYLHRGWSD